MAQGDNRTGQKGTDAMFVMTHKDIKHALRAGEKITYCNPVVDHSPQKEDPNRIRLTAGGNLIHCIEELSVPTAGLETVKLHWNSVVSTAMAKYMYIDLKNFYLTAKLEFYEYMTISLAYFPPWIVDQYNLNLHALNGKVHLELQQAVWGLPQAGILANKQLRRKLAPFGNKEHAHTPGLWYHEMRPNSFTLVVDDFGIKYVNKADVEHLLESLQDTYKITADRTGDIYCGITLGWNYDKRYVDISMPGYIKKENPGIRTHCPQ
jgi:hypothetical protein